MERERGVGDSDGGGGELEIVMERERGVGDSDGGRGELEIVMEGEGSWR